MQEIIRARLALLSADEQDVNDSQFDQMAQVIQPAALTLLVKKVSSQTGDIRHALEVLRRAIDLAAPATSALESDDVAPSPVGMKHVIDAVKRTAKNESANATGAPSLANAGGSGRGPLDGCISSLSLQARFVLVSILVARRRAAHNLPVESLSPSSAFSFNIPSPSSLPPSTPTRSKMRRNASLGSTDAVLSPSKVYTLYTNILNASPSTPFEPVSRSEYTDLLGVLETASLISVPSVSSPSPTKPKRSGGRKAGSFSGGMSIGSFAGRDDQGSIALCAAEEEVLRALLASAGARDAEIARIWERESKRVDQAIASRSEAPVEPELAREEYL